MSAVAVALLSGVVAGNLFPVPQGMEPNVGFWLRVYTEWPTNRYAIHDDQRLDVVYDVIEATDGRSTTVRNAKSEVEAALARLDEKRPGSESGLTGIDLKVHRALAGLARDPQRFARARGHVRHQKGQRDRFAEALRTSGRYRGQIEQVLEEHGVPRELIALVFVESMWQLGARSYSGATGFWQFMHATGREYLNINDVVDERRDPIIASYAAASYLRSAIKRLEVWPVAITSYNYGMNGMARAVESVGTHDLAAIFRSYRSGSLGFAAKNYYTEFLAALRVWKNPKRYFPDVNPGRPWRYDVVRLPAPTTATALVKAGVVSDADLKQLNPALSREALAGRVKLPQGMSLRIARGGDRVFAQRFARIPAAQRRVVRGSDKVHTVKPGDNITRIARRYKVTTGQVLSANNLRRDQSIHPGMQLRIPPRSVSTTQLPEARGIKVAALPPVVATPEPVAAAPEPTTAAPEPVAVAVQDKPPAAPRGSVDASPRARKPDRSRRPVVKRMRQGSRRIVVVAGPASAGEEFLPRQLEAMVAVDVVSGRWPLPPVDTTTGLPRAHNPAGPRQSAALLQPGP